MIIIFRISELRKERGIQQKDLAEMLHIAPNALCQYETGARAVPSALLPAIAAALGCKIEDLYKKEN